MRLLAPRFLTQVQPGSKSKVASGCTFMRSKGDGPAFWRRRAVCERGTFTDGSPLTHEDAGRRGPMPRNPPAALAQRHSEGPRPLQNRSRGRGPYGFLLGNSLAIM